MSYEPMPELTMALHRGHSMRRADDGAWACLCGGLTLPADTDGSQVFAAFIDHAENAPKGAVAEEDI